MKEAVVLHLDGGVGGVVHHSRGESVEAEESHHNLYHCAQFKRGPKIFRKGTKRGPDFEQKGDLKGTKRGPKKGTQNSGCSKNQKEITS